MRIKLLAMKVENFKGIKMFDMVLNGERGSVEGQNGSGKTSLVDGFLWLFFDKNLEGKTTFGAYPVDKNNKPIKGLVVMVKALMMIGDEVHEFKKELKETVVKGQVTGYESLCYIDEVPKRVGDFKKKIAEILPEDTFKMLTDLSHFNGKMHWRERREILLKVAGDVGKPEGFDVLLGDLNGRTMDEMKALYSVEKTKLMKERKAINPRIDEINRGSAEYVEGGDDVDELQERRSRIEGQLGGLDEKQREVLAGEKDRDRKMMVVDGLKSRKGERERALKSDTSNTQDLLDEKKKILLSKSQATEEFNDSSREMDALENKKKVAEDKIESLKTSRTRIKADYNEASVEIEENCPKCRRKLTAVLKKEFEEDRQPELNVLLARGARKQEEIDEWRDVLVVMDREIAELDEVVIEAAEKLEEVEIHRKERFVEIDKLIENAETPDPEKDSIWLAICEDLTKAESDIPESLSEQIQGIVNERKEMSDAIANINNLLATSDRREADQKRIKELKSREKEIAQRLADLEKCLKEVGDYVRAESELINDVVNEKFEVAEFRMFREQMNGEMVDCCDVIYNGVEYRDLSTGERIYVGIDIVGVLSKHWDVYVPLFIDHMESLTLPVEIDTQVVKLYAREGVKKLSLML